MMLWIKVASESQRNLNGRFRTVFATDRFGFSGVLKYNFVLISGDREEAGDLRYAKVLLLFRIGVGGSSES